MYVVAEGVETVEERDYLLASTGIVCGQGYLFCRPKFVDDLITCHDLAAIELRAG